MRQLDFRSQHLVTKVRRYRKFGKLVGPFVIVGVLVICILEWALGAVPLVWVVYGISIMHFPMIGLVQMILAKTAKPSDSSSQQLLLSSPALPSTSQGRSNSLITDRSALL